MATGRFRSPARLGLALLFALPWFSCGCSEVRGRRLIQRGNELYQDGRYAEAVAIFRQAERFVPDFWVLWINMGYTCRQMLIPGAKTPENAEAARCALDAFLRLQKTAPHDSRGWALYEQTLFETDQYETLARMYTQRIEEKREDEEALNGLIQVYSKWSGHFDGALGWYRKKADLKSRDAEAQYAVGVFIWHELFTHGGGADKAAFDPRPEPGKGKASKKPPPVEGNEIGESRRIELSDIGIQYMQRALEQRPKYQEATTYLNLLYRQKSFAYFNDPDRWQENVSKATGHAF